MSFLGLPVTIDSTSLIVLVETPIVQDRVVKNIRRIACRYLARWFLIDFTVVAFDWLNLGITMAATGGDSEGSSTVELMSKTRFASSSRFRADFGTLLQSSIRDRVELVREEHP